jgi:hypothetical protein
VTTPIRARSTASSINFNYDSSDEDDEVDDDSGDSDPEPVRAPMVPYFPWDDPKPEPVTPPNAERRAWSEAVAARAKAALAEHEAQEDRKLDEEIRLREEQEQLREKVRLGIVMTQPFPFLVCPYLRV